MTIEKQLHQFGFARDLGKDDLLCVCGVFFVVVVAQLVRSSQSRNIYQPSLSFSQSRVPVGDTVTSTSKAKQEYEWVESSKVRHIMSEKDPHRCTLLIRSLLFAALKQLGLAECKFKSDK